MYVCMYILFRMESSCLLPAVGLNHMTPPTQSQKTQPSVNLRPAPLAIGSCTGRYVYLTINHGTTTDIVRETSIRLIKLVKEILQ